MTVPVAGGELDPFFIYQVDYSRALSDACPGEDWQHSLIELALTESLERKLDTNIDGSREDPNNRSVDTIYTVPTAIINKKLGWFIELMREDALPLAKRIVGNDIEMASQPQNIMNLNTQYAELVEADGEERVPGGYDGHIDFDAATITVQATTHPSGTGGELRIATSHAARSPREIDQSCRVIHPVAGTLTIMNGRLPHYVTRPLTSNRVNAVVNLYNGAYPEEDRPQNVSLYSEGFEPFPDAR